MISSACEDLSFYFFTIDYDVYAIHKYNSQLIHKYCKKNYVIKDNCYQKIKNIIDEIDPFQKMEILIGSGFIEEIQNNKLIGNRLNRGNNPSIIYNIKSKKFFHMMAKNKINHPDWKLKAKLDNGWLIKSHSSFGGQKVWSNFNQDNLSEDIYFQKIIIGQHISIQFLVEKGKIKILCFCKQHFLQEETRPFIISGITTISLKEKIKRKMLSIVKKISKFYSLNGLNSIDTVIDNDEKVYLIEINPRPGLALKLLSKIYGKKLFKIDSKLNKKIPNIGTVIIYSPKNLIYKNCNRSFLIHLKNSNKYSELPYKNDHLRKGSPICLKHFSFSKNENLEEKFKKITYKFLKDLLYEDKYKSNII